MQGNSRLGNGFAEFQVSEVAEPIQGVGRNNDLPEDVQVIR